MLQVDDIINSLKECLLNVSDMESWISRIDTDVAWFLIECVVRD